MGATLAVVLLALVVLPAAAWAGRRHGRSVKGGVALTAMLFGFGEGIDPPTRARIEAVSDDDEAAPAPGDPPVPKP